MGYRPFMMVLQQQVSLLDKFVIQQESIPNLLTSNANNSKPNATNLLKINENLDNFPHKNVSKEYCFQKTTALNFFFFS